MFNSSAVIYIDISRWHGNRRLISHSLMRVCIVQRFFCLFWWHACEGGVVFVSRLLWDSARNCICMFTLVSDGPNQSPINWHYSMLWSDYVGGVGRLEWLMNFSHSCLFIVLLVVLALVELVGKGILLVMLAVLFLYWHWASIELVGSNMFFCSLWLCSTSQEQDEVLHNGGLVELLVDWGLWYLFRKE